MDDKIATHNAIAREMDRLEALKIRVIIGFAIFWFLLICAFVANIWYFWIK